MSEQAKKKAAKFRRLQQKYRDQLPERLNEIGEAWHVALASALDSEALTLFHRQLHSLAGSAGTFGYQQLGATARKLESRVIESVQGDRVETLDRETVESMLSQLLQLSSQPPGEVYGGESYSPKTKETCQAAGDQRRIYLLEDDPLLAEEISKQLSHFGYSVEIFDSADALAQAYSKQSPQVLIADIVFPSGDLEGPRIASQLHSLHDAAIPVIYISARDDWKTRLEAVRAGGQAYLCKPLDFSILVEQLDRLSGRHEATPFRILVVDDTALLAEHYADVLKGAGMEVEVLTDASQLLSTLPEFQPDLILMDIYMPVCNGTEAAQVIRQHTAYQNIPIVYLSTERELNEQLAALRAGGDDFLQKPIAGEHLIAAVTIRASRFRGLNALMVRDSLTGLLNHINMKLALEREVNKAQRNGSSFSFAMLDIDHFKLVNDNYGHPVGDRVIKSLARLLVQRLRKSDIAARYGGEEFALILPDTPGQQAAKIIEGLLANFSDIHFVCDDGEFSSTFSAGIIEVKPHMGIEEVIQQADSALYRAKNSGRSQVSIIKANTE